MLIMLALYILTFVKRSGYLDVYLGQKHGLKIQYSIYILVWMRGTFKSNLKICLQAKGRLKDTNFLNMK